jgi:pyruvate dehydrogenase E2 component (dihydrolipoamide acetyltransferase)
MAFSIVMPALEMAQETGKLLAWRKKEGERVSKGEPLLEIETDKAVVEVEAPADGVLAGIKALEGADIPVGQTIAWIVAPGETPPVESAAAAPGARAAVEPLKPEPTRASHAPGAASALSRSGLRVSPKARRLAKELGIDVALVRGSGADGEILASDVEAAARTAPASSTPAPAQKSGSMTVPTSLGRIMAERTTESWTTIPHFFVRRDIDAGAFDQYREQFVRQIESRHQVRVTHTDLLTALVARVLLKHPRLNASWTAAGIRLHEQVNIAVAIAVSDGVVAAVIRDAHAASLHQIALQRREVAERARAGKLRPTDLSDATFTISNLGMYKVDQFSAIITAPQSAVLAVGRIAERVVAVAGKPAVRPMMTLTISCDHRVTDGARAAMFLSELADAMGEPAKFLPE